MGAFLQRWVCRWVGHVVVHHGVCSPSRAQQWMRINGDISGCRLTRLVPHASRPAGLGSSQGSAACSGHNQRMYDA
jgi:hypothetical protein